MRKALHTTMLPTTSNGTFGEVKKQSLIFDSFSTRRPASMQGLDGASRFVRLHLPHIAFNNVLC
eukprot:m.922590 g.922590  ORF g.922590 m.922590 type:complete len:64 (-) comp23759_c0_seq7:128-319(-)